MLTAADVADLLGLKPRTVYDIPEADLPRYRMGKGGGAVRFAPADVEAYRASCRSTGTRPAHAGAMSFRASLTDADDALRSYFQRRGLEPRQKPTPASATPSSTPLRRVR